MTSASNNLLSLAPKGTKPLWSVPTAHEAQPSQSLLFQPDVLLRASLSDTPLNNNNNNACMSLLDTIAQTLLQAQQEELKHQLLKQLFKLQAQVTPQVTGQDIIGMGISFPNLSVPPASASTSSTLSAGPTSMPISKSNASSVEKMKRIGSPLSAPPPLCTTIQKRPATVTQTAAAPENKRRKIAPFTSSDKLEFLQTAQRLHDVRADASLAASSLSLPREKDLSRSPLASKALKAPPTLGI